MSHKNKTIIWKFFLVAIFFFVGFLLVTRIAPAPVIERNLADIKEIKIAGQNIKVNLALTPEAQAQGLSGRKSLEKNKGMLFVFSKSDKYAFWMKDMNFSIDMIWIGENMQVIYIKENALPSSYPETYEPSGNAKYILEVVSGFSKKNNLKIGDKVEFVY